MDEHIRDTKSEQRAARIAPSESPLETIKKQNILERWGLNVDELTEIVDANPSLRGMMLGYVAEHVVKKLYFSDARITELVKDDDHDRKRKGDHRFIYSGRSFKIEVKSLQTDKIKSLGDGKFQATFQCDASDRRPVKFSNGSSVETTCLLVGEFDIVAVNLFALDSTWRFAFALNKDLPRTKSKKYTKLQKKELLSSSMPITWPLEHPYVADPFALMDSVVNGEVSQPKPASIL